MDRPAARTLYILIAVFVVLLVLAFIARGFLAAIFFLLAAAVVGYFAFVAVSEFRRTPKR